MKKLILGILLLLVTGCAVYTPAPYYYGEPYPHYYYRYPPYYSYRYYPYYGYPAAPPPPRQVLPPPPSPRAARPLPRPKPAPPPAPKVIDKMTLHVLFDFDKSILTEADVKELQKAVTFVKKYPGANIRLDGYTDFIGADAYNIKLSERRAAAVKDYLIKEAGISSSRITAVGHGKANPVADNKTEEGRAKNRRVEISILSD